MSVRPSRTILAPTSTHQLRRRSQSWSSRITAATCTPLRRARRPSSSASTSVSTAASRSLGQLSRTTPAWTRSAPSSTAAAISAANNSYEKARQRVRMEGLFEAHPERVWAHSAAVASVDAVAGSRVINISSSTTGLMLSGYGVYDATKGAIEAMSHVISKEFGPRRITVNVVSPSATETETYRNGKSEAFLAGLEAMSVFGRLGRPEEIATVVVFLASDRGHWITAQNVRVNGGTV